jgi:hypothetical protein
MSIIAATNVCFRLRTMTVSSDRWLAILPHSAAGSQTPIPEPRFSGLFAAISPPSVWFTWFSQ